MYLCGSCINSRSSSHSVDSKRCASSVEFPGSQAIKNLRASGLVFHQEDIPNYRRHSELSQTLHASRLNFLCDQNVKGMKTKSGSRRYSNQSKKNELIENTDEDDSFFTINECLAKPEKMKKKKGTFQNSKRRYSSANLVVNVPSSVVSRRSSCMHLYGIPLAAVEEYSSPK